MIFYKSAIEKPMLLEKDRTAELFAAARLRA